jgi:predicted dehydrogenase
MKKENKTSSSAMPRRDFLKVSALGAAAALAGPSLLASCAGGSKTAKLTPLKQPGEYYIPDLPDKAPDGRPLKAGLVGCGGRGTGAAANLLRAADGVEIVALGDVFADRLEGARASLKKNFNMEVAEENCFLGFDAYQKVIDSGVDIVLLCTPPAFRPAQFKYAVEKGVHSFIEKPVCVDADGYRSVVASARAASAKGLSVITGTQRHHQRSYLASYQKIMEGAIGEIRGGNVYWNQNQLWYRTKQQGWTDMEWMIRDWVNWTWLCGDEIVEQHVHNIDVFTWFSGLKPVRATGVGSRQRRVTGDGYDNFSIDFEFENGIHLHSMCRQIDGCSGNVSETIHGTKGVWYGGGDDPYIVDLEGNEVWRFDRAAVEAQYSQNDPYTLEHVNLVASIRSGVPVNQAEETAISTLAGVLGRDAAYTGLTVSWDEESAKTHGLVPETVELKDVDMSVYKVPVPGTAK